MWPTRLLHRYSRGCSRLIPKWNTGRLLLIGGNHKLKIPSVLVHVHCSGLLNHRALQIADQHGGSGRRHPCIVPLSLVTKHITDQKICKYPCCYLHCVWLYGWHFVLILTKQFSCIIIQSRGNSLHDLQRRCRLGICFLVLFKKLISMPSESTNGGRGINIWNRCL